MASIIPTTLLFDVGLGLPSFSSRKMASFLVILVFGVLLVLERQFPNSKAPTHKLRSVLSDKHQSVYFQQYGAFVVIGFNIVGNGGTSFKPRLIGVFIPSCLARNCGLLVLSVVLANEAINTVFLMFYHFAPTSTNTVK